jgi:hypothetical protein
MRARASLALPALFIICAAALPAAADEWDKTWQVSGGTQVLVNADDGNIRVEPGSATLVTARIRTSGWHIGDDEVRVLEKQTGNRVELELKVPSRVFSFSFRREISIELTVPRNAELDLHTGDGNITTRGLEGPLRSNTGDGNITIVGGKGTIQLHTGDGNIEADDLDGSLAADTGDGNVEVTGRFDVVEARTGDGNVQLTADPGSRVSSAWKIRTGDGDITLRMPEGIAADIDAHTGDGHVSCDFAVSVSGKMEASNVRGPINGGGPPLELRTGDGNIRVAKR